MDVELDGQFNINMVVRVQVDVRGRTAIFSITNGSSTMKEYSVELEDLVNNENLYPFVMMCGNGA